MARIPSVIAAFLLIISTALGHDGDHSGRETPHWQKASTWPDRIIVTPGSDPQTSFAVTWRTDQSVGRTVAQIAPATADARFDLLATTHPAQTERLRLDEYLGPDGTIEVLENMGLPPAHYHSVIFDKLEPDTAYAYRVRGPRGHWSAWRHVRTAPNDGPIAFLFFGDAQKGIRSHITRIFDQAAISLPKPHFVIHGGDLVNTAMFDQEWAEWFEAMGRTALTVPSILVTGNHDYVNFDKDKDRSSDGKLFVARKSVSPLWRPQFTLPNNPDLPGDLQETVYDIRYTDDIHIFVLDSSGVAWDRQLAWFEHQAKESDATFIIVTMHHPLFSFVGGNEHPAARQRRLALLETLETGLVDLVLTGHRHTYQRSAYGDDVGRFAIGDEQSIETLFVTTASSTGRGRTKTDGWDRYEDEQNGDFALARHGDNTPLFASITVDGATLTYQAIDAVGTVYDAFVLTKKADGSLILRNDDVVDTPVRTYDNTGPYRDWDDLR